MRIITFLLLFICSTSQAQTVFMALWRGETDAERGFKDYLLAQSDLDIEFIIADANKDIEQVKGFPEQIMQASPDLVYTFGTTVSLNVAGNISNPNANLSAPLVFNIVADPVGAGLVTQFQNQGRNLTGTSHLVPLQTQLNAIDDLGVFSHIGVIYNPQEKNSQLQVSNLQELLAKSAQFTLSTFAIDVELPLDEQLEQMISRAKSAGVDILYLPSDSFMISNAAVLSQFAQQAELPIFSATEGPVKNGHALLGLVSKYYLVGQFAGFKAAQILRGKPAEQIPVETLTRFNFMVNMDVAKALDFYPPVTVLRSAIIYPE